MHHGEDGEDGGGQAAGPNKAWPRLVNPQPVQWDEDIATVLQQVQQQRWVAVQHRHQQVQLLAEPRGDGGGSVVRGERVVSGLGTVGVE